MRDILLSALVAAFAVWAIVVAAMSVFQPSFIFFPSREIMATPAQAGLVYEPIEIRARDGVRLSGWYIPAAEARLTVLFLHGNAGNISHRLMALHALHGLGLAVLILDYRGYGESSGSPSEEGTYRDALAGWEYLTTTLDIAADRVVLFGESLGGAVATWIATREHPAGLILESTFTTMHELAGRFYPYFPARLLLRVEYPTLERLPRVRCPVLVIHSPDDEIVPYEHGERLFAAAPGRKQFVKRQGGHNDAFLAGTELLVAGIERFITRIQDGGRDWGQENRGEDRGRASDRVRASQ
ncbi:MAG: alpha/beta hydrolase [Gammaproteobacteria bacterium]